MLDLLGRYYRRYADDSYWRPRILRTYPAVQVLATTNAAIEHYDAGGFWPKLAQLLDTPNTQTFQREWGEAFLDNLAALRLPTFANAEADAGTKFVGRILLHCGVPTKCLDDYFRIVTEQRLKKPELDAERFVAWAAVRAEGGRLFNVDMPVNRFLRFGGEFAVDVTDRIFELLDSVSAGGDGSDVPLPERFRLKAIELHQAGEIERVSSRGGSTTTAIPRIVLDPHGGGPLLHLPPVGDASDGTATWIVTLDADPQRVATTATWPGSAEPAPATSVPIPRPIRAASVALEGRESLVVNVSVVNDNDPFLVFSDDGTMLPTGLTLPGRPVWLLVPGPASQLSYDGKPRVIAEAPVPPGWSQWSLTLVDLGNVRSVTFGGGKPHGVRDFRAARIEVGQPLDGVRTSGGAPVFTKIPEIDWPPDLSSDTNWEVSLLDNNGDLLKRSTVKPGDSTADLWQEQQRPLLGTFTVRVRGPWGRGATRTVFIAEGLRISSSPKWRRLTPGGLVPAEVCAEPARGMDVDTPVVALHAHQRDCHLNLSAHGRSATVQVIPPHMYIAYQSTDTTTGPSLRVHQLYTEDVIADPGTLILSMGAEAAPTVAVFSGVQHIQTLEPGAGRNGIYRFNLAQLVDTLAAFRQLTLSLGEDGVLPIASIRPKRLFAGVSIRAESLVFSQCADIAGLVALVYATRAPWRRPTVLQIKDGSAALPEFLVDAGPLLITVRIDDPWAPEPIPDWPEVGRSKVAHADGWLLSDDDEDAAVSAFLAGLRSLPEHINDLTRLWTVRATLASLALDHRLVAVRDEIEQALFRQPRQALVALAESTVPTAAIPGLVIRSGLPWADLSSAHSGTPPAWTTRGALPAALLSAADEEWSSEEVDAAIEVCGDVVPQVLRGEDPYPAAGRFDGGADIYAADPVQRDRIVEAMALVPQGLLGRDTRVIAAMELIPHCKDDRLGWLVRRAASLLGRTERLLGSIAPPEVLNSFRARMHPTADGGWRVLPAISLSLAFAARYAARGNETALRHVVHERHGWADLAETAPQLVTIDLILAELTVAGAESRKKGRSS